MKNNNEKIKFTPIEKLFKKKELEKMIEMIKPRTHECHRNSWLLAQFYKSQYPTLEYNEGLYSYNFPHAFNSMVINGVRHYFDITSYINKIEHDIEPCKEGILLRSYTPKEIFRKFYKDKAYYITVEVDGTVFKYVRDNFYTKQNHKRIETVGAYQ